MFKDEYQSVCNAAKGKLGLLEKSPLGYFVSSIVAGMFIALGGFVTFTLGAHLTAAHRIDAYQCDYQADHGFRICLGTESGGHGRSRTLYWK